MKRLEHVCCTKQDNDNLHNFNLHNAPICIWLMVCIVACRKLLVNFLYGVGQREFIFHVKKYVKELRSDVNDRHRQPFAGESMATSPSWPHFVVNFDDWSDQNARLSLPPTIWKMAGMHSQKKKHPGVCFYWCWNVWPHLNGPMPVPDFILCHLKCKGRGGG